MMPHGVAPPKQRRYNNPWSKSSTGGATDMFGTSKTLLFVLLIATPSFLLGTTVSLYMGVDCTSTSVGQATTKQQESDPSNDFIIQQKVDELLRKKEILLMEKHQTLVHKMVREQCEKMGGSTTTTKSQTIVDPDAVGNIVAGVALTPKLNFTDTIDLGVPVDKLKRGSDHVMVLYSSSKAMPNSLQSTSKKQTYSPKVGTQEALENCEYLNVLLLDHSGSRKQCLALVPQYESYHLQKWMRVPEKSNGLHGAIEPEQSLKLVSRGLNGKGKEEFPPPKTTLIDRTFDMLKNYLVSLPDVTADLKKIIEQDLKPYNGKAIIVMVCNFGQSELLINFVCDAKSKGFDISSILVFATDQETEALAKSIGLAAYYDEHNFGNIPAEAAKRYGDIRFSAMMVAKVVCVQLINYLGYDFLFQDVDILWYQHPLSDYFAKPGHWSEKYDAIFQDDGGHSVRYAPYSANSGFYYVRCNGRTRSFVNTLLMNSQIVMETDSHQQAMIAILNEQVSLYGLRVKVVSRDADDMPGGFQWNKKDKVYMKALFKGEITPIIFHMSWTYNKDNKLKYFQQMGAWHVEEKCIAKKKEEIPGASNDLTSTCCAAEPIFKCHYRDKPSLHPCKDSPPIDQGRPSFW